MIGVIDFLLIIILLILTTYVIIFEISSVIDNKLYTLKTDFEKIKCDKNIETISLKNNNEKNTIETYSGLPDKTTEREENVSQYIANKSNQSTEELLKTVINDEDISKIENPNFNTYNNLPYLIAPQNSNEGYYYNRVKLITNPNSPLLKKATENMKRIDLQLKECANKNLTNTRDISGYNNYENLSEDSYANVTSIGKSLLTPYTSYPLPS
jgi:hypothetical protein